MLERIAINIALIPNAEMRDFLIEINKELLKHKNGPIKLGSDKYLPHITLYMGVIERDKLPVVSKMIERILEKQSGLELEVVGVYADDIATGDSVAGLAVKITDELKELHTKIMNKMINFRAGEARVSSFYDSENVDPMSTMWVNNFMKNSSFDNYFPHITVGFGNIEQLDLPIPFIASRIVICHKGNFCTCADIKWEKELN